MRLLLLTNLYPPHAAGGYEQWCQEVAVELRDRGHAVAVLTSLAKATPNADDRDDGIDVRRLLHLEVVGGIASTAVRVLRDRQRLERESLEQLDRLVEDFRPDVALVWGMWNIPRAVPSRLEGLLPGRTVFYLCDYWLNLPSAYIQQLENPSIRPLNRLAKRLVARYLLGRLRRDAVPALRLDHPICVSQAVRDLLVKDGVPIEHAEVMPGGIQIDDFLPRALARWERDDGPLRLVYAGRLTEEKGVHTAVQAMEQIVRRAGRPVLLDIVGTGADAYVDRLNLLVRNLRLGEYVHFRPRVPRDRMPNLLADYDLLLFPSEWPEPFSRAVMEAMAVGLVVIGTTTGGTGGILVDNETGLTFPAGDATALARQIERLRFDCDLGLRLAANGRAKVEASFTFKRMVDDIEAYLESLLPARVG